MDSTTIIIGNRTVASYVRYSVRHNIYAAAGSYELDLPPSEMDKINELDRIEIKVAGITVLTGLVERIEEAGKKGESVYRVSGRDLMGLVVDEYVQSFRTLTGKKLLQVAEYFLSQMPLIRHLNRTYLDGAEGLDVPQEWVQPQPGQTVFDLLSSIAAARGIHFYMRADGNIVFGKPRGFGAHIHSIYRTSDRNSNVVEWSRIRDFTQRYSTVIVLGQQQSKFDVAVSAINKKTIATDDAFPAGVTKTMVVETQTAAQTLAQQAQMIIEQQRFAGWSVRYVVGGHTQRGYVWQPDSICSVDDYRLRLQGEFLIYGRTLVGDKANKSTELILGKMA